MNVGIPAGDLGHGWPRKQRTAKPMVEIGPMPILWHIMMHYHRYGHRDFAIALGYKRQYIKRRFSDYIPLNGSLTVRAATRGCETPRCVTGVR
jgi:glucose-1-phosphate cytidylyltransferase